MKKAASYVQDGNVLYPAVFMSEEQFLYCMVAGKMFEQKERRPGASYANLSRSYQ